MSGQAMDGFSKDSFAAPVAGRETRYDVYRIGAGPPVIIMQEMPGIGSSAIAMCRRLADAGFEVWAPHWFGPLGRTTASNALRVLCMRREFQLFAKNKSSAIVDWMRALCRHVAEVRNTKRVGVIGMCLTGNFAMTLIAEESVWAAVASQPSLPGRSQGALHMSSDEVAAARAALDAKGSMHAYRFSGDPICTGKKFEAIDAAFNDDGVRVVLNVIEGPGHSVFTRQFDPTPGSGTAAAHAQLVGYLRERLLT